MKVVVFISGRGSNLQTLIQRQNNYEVVHVISNRATANGLTVAQEHQILTTVIPWKDHVGAEQKALDVLCDIKPDLIVLAGFMRVLSADFVSHFKHKIINIHPSLLPLYPGLNTHQRALDDKQTQHGATVHYVDETLDLGQIISQCHIQVHPEDNAETLADRLLSKEHNLLYKTVKNIASGHIYWQDNQLHHNGQIIQQAITWSDNSLK